MSHWMLTATGGKRHFVPASDSAGESLCGAMADYWPGEEEVMSAPKCKVCERKRQRVARGRDDEMDPWEVQ